MNSLYQNSLDLILSNQSKTGAIIACPNFATYRYAWFRDGSFCAHAIAQAGYLEEAANFHQWASQTVLRYQDKILKCIRASLMGTPPVAEMCFHSRFTTDGKEVPGNWGHHQLDGLGTWLWAMKEYQQLISRKELPENWQQAASLAKDYLIAMWPFPCSDSWEENETLQHTYTLGAIYAGLTSYAELFEDTRVHEVANDIRIFIFNKCVQDGAFVKSIGLPDVDANLIGLYAPYRVVEWSNPIFQKTLKKIQSDLATPVGLHRYRQDVYYGGGEWILLTAWLGWAYAQSGELEKAQIIADWIETQSAAGYLAEQVPHAIFDKSGYDLWFHRWGPIASPLMWSHAKYMLLIKSLKII